MKWFNEVKSITPKQDATWYVKWSVSIIMLLGMAVGRGTGNPNSMIMLLGMAVGRGTGNPEWQIYDTAASWIGALGWYWVGYKWGDRAMQLVNGVMLFILTVGLIKQLNLI
jgi:membrane protein DedA with SNARE-associated domain